jgi:hypothetical protein
MFELAGALVCVVFFVPWSFFVMANIMQIRDRKTRDKQTLNHNLSRMNVVCAVGMFIENLATLADYFLVDGAFLDMDAFGTIL